MEERKLLDIVDVEIVLNDTINSEGDYRHALRLVRDLNYVTEQDVVKHVLKKIRVEMLEERISHSGTGEEVIQAYADGLEKGLEILDKYMSESEV